MKLTTPSRRVGIIASVSGILALMVIAVVTAVRLGQLGSEPVAPNVPKSKPRAFVQTPTPTQAIPTPGPDSLCQASWVIPSLTPTSTGIPTQTPAPTATTQPEATSSPTPPPQAAGPTAIPTVPKEELPLAGNISGTIGTVVGGLGILLIGLLLLL